ncbi:hypothetical protein BLSTO_00955 [Blastocystis sp. subtype 1]
MEYPVLGIDLGTCFSCVYGFKNGQFVAVPGEAGGNTTPSVIQYRANGIVCGRGAKNTIRGNAENTIYDVKRFLGLPYDQCAGIIEHERYGFRCIRYDPTMVYEMKVGESMLFKTPEMVDADFLGYLASRAEAYLGYHPEGVVITVPAFFQYSQIDATIRAAQAAGLHVYQTIYEPSAAAMAVTPIPTLDEKYILVYDLGGGTFDVAIIRSSLHDYNVIGNNGHPFLGGRDFDQVVFDIAARRLATIDVDITTWNANKLARLRTYCEQVKIELSSSNAFQFSFGEFGVDADVPLYITRAQFQEGIRRYIQLSIEICDAALQRAGVHLMQGRDSILLVGGSSKIPLVRAMLQEHYGNIVRADNNPDEDVAKGACLLALKGYCDRHPPLPNPCPVMIPHSFVMRPVGISFGNGQVDEILPAGTPCNEERERVGNNFVIATTVRVYCRDLQEREWRRIAKFTVNAFRGAAYVRLVLNEMGRLRYSVGVVGQEPMFQNTLEIAKEDADAIVQFNRKNIAIQRGLQILRADLERERTNVPPRDDIVRELNRGIAFLESDNAFRVQLDGLNQYVENLHRWYLTLRPSLVCFVTSLREKQPNPKIDSDLALSFGTILVHCG